VITEYEVGAMPAFTRGDGGWVLEFLKNTILFVSALFPVVNPLGGSPIFLGLTRDYSTVTRTVLARRITWNSFFLLAASFLVGTHILTFFGISLPVVQVGGGLIVVSTGWAMLNQKDDEGQRNAARHKVDQGDIFKKAFYPLTMPLTVGPGSISIAITLGANAPRHHGLNILPIVAALVGSVLVAFSVFLCYSLADRLAKLLGPTGMSVILRLSSFLLVCIGVQIIWNGVKALLASLP
jgi:multiple antibiotic resistance protein